MTRNDLIKNFVSKEVESFTYKFNLEIKMC
ncbi:MAG: hypothetical protein K0S74_1331 [Chlamydiales bacterium]|jgi:hypothetical protein|nr:hypothetical protein [Chlamydiales bacterium]